MSEFHLQQYFIVEIERNKTLTSLIWTIFLFRVIEKIGKASSVLSFPSPNNHASLKFKHLVVDLHVYNYIFQIKIKG